MDLLGQKCLCSVKILTFILTKLLLLSIITSAMFIRKARKADRITGTKYIYHQPVESYRTPDGPGQKILLNLGRLDLATRIEEILKGKRRIFEVSPRNQEPCP
ncbi:MAG: hypothetical protein WHS38_12295 [Thermodesulforhabdaceae bacterium]